jgi:glycerophosphoryl diester phosphodiesterase
MRENTLAAFRNALERGARALESDVWLSGDQVPVLVHDRLVRKGLRRMAISAMTAADAPSWLPTLDAVYAELGGDFEFSLDVKDAAAALPTIRVAAVHGAAERLWLCCSAGNVRSWRADAQGAHLVVSTTLRAGRTMLDERIDEAAEVGADAVNLKWLEWSAERVQRCHGHGLFAFAWDVQQRNVLDRVREFGCDGIFSDHVSLLSEA